MPSKHTCDFSHILFPQILPLILSKCLGPSGIAFCYQIQKLRPQPSRSLPGHSPPRVPSFQPDLRPQTSIHSGRKGWTGVLQAGERVHRFSSKEPGIGPSCTPSAASRTSPHPSVLSSYPVGPTGCLRSRAQKWFAS